MKTDNKTLYGIKDSTERYILIFWNLTVLLVSLFGDSNILIGTIKYKAINQPKAILAVMQNMAACDILQTVFRVFPSTIALITDSWVFGEPLCHLDENIGFVCGGMTLFLTCAMTTQKLIIVKFPLRTAAWSSRLAHKICSSLWILQLCCCIPVLVGNMFYIRNTIHFSYRDYSCNYDYTSSSVPTWHVLSGLAFFYLFSFIGYTTLIITSTSLLMVAKRAASRHREPMRWEGVATVLLTVAVFLVSYLPWGVVFTTSILGMQYSSTVIRAVFNLMKLNILANFFIYSLTVPSFRKFLKSKISHLLSSRRLSFPQRQRQNTSRQGPAKTQDRTEVSTRVASLPSAVELQLLQQEEQTRRIIPIITQERPV